MTKHVKELDQEIATALPADFKNSIENLEARIRGLRAKRQTCRAAIF